MQKILLREGLSVFGCLFDNGKLIYGGRYGSIAECQNDLNKRADANPATAIAHWTTTEVIPASGIRSYLAGEHTIPMRYDAHVTVQDGKNLLASGISNMELNNDPGDYQFSLSGALLRMIRECYDDQISDSIQIAFVVFTADMVRTYWFDRLSLVAYTQQPTAHDDPVQGLRQALLDSFGKAANHRSHLTKIIGLGYHPNLNDINMDFVRGGAVFEWFDTRRAFDEAIDLNDSHFASALSRFGHELNRTGYPLILAAVAHCLQTGYGPEFSNAFPTTPPEKKKSTWQGLRFSGSVGLPKIAQRNPEAVSFVCGLVVLLLLAGTGFFWFSIHEKNLLEQENTANNRISRAGSVQESIDRLTRHRDDTNRLITIANELKAVHEDNNLVLAAVYAQVPNGVALSDVVTNGKQTKIAGYVSIANAAAVTSSDPNKGPQGPIQTEDLVSKFVDKLKGSGDFAPDIQPRFSKNGDKGEFVIFVEFTRHRQIPPNLETVKVPEELKKLATPTAELTQK